MNIILEELYFIWNGGPGSGNFNPGQGRGVGKPSNQYKMSESFKEVFDEINSESNGEFKKEFDAVIENFRKSGVDTSKVKFVASKNDIPESKRGQLENDSVKGMTFSNKNLEAIIYVDEDRMFDYGIDAKTSYKEGKQMKDQPWATDNSPIGIIKHELGHVASYTLFMNSRGRKGTSGPIVTGAVRLDINSRFKQIFGNNYDFSKLKLSRYGNTTQGEAVAESFANPEFSEDTKKIYDYYVKEMTKNKVENSLKNEDDDWIQLCEGYTLEEHSRNSLEKITSSVIDAITTFSEYIEKSINGGKGSGNFNPGQGRGVGKPSDKSKKISYEEYVEKWKKSTRSEKRELAEKYPEYDSQHWDELMGNYKKRREEERKQKELEEKFKTYEKDNSHPHFDLNNAVSEFKSALDISPDEYNGDWNEKEKRFEKLKNLKEYYNKNKDVEVKVYSVSPLEYSKIIIENNKNHDYKTMHDVIRRTSEEGIDMYVKKFEKGDRVEIPYIKFDKEGNYSGEQEGFHRTFAADRVNDTEIPIFIVQSYKGKKPQINYGRDITKDVENYYLRKKTSNNRNSRLDAIFNGGPNSGNHNPGQGRGKGKPNNSPSKIIDSYKEKYSDFWLNGIGDNGFETATKKGAENYKNIVELIKKQKDIEWGSGEYDRMTERIMDSQDEIENNFKTLCENNLTEHDFYKIKNLFYDWSTNLGPRGKDGLFLDTLGIILEKDSEAFGLYKAYIQTILYESGITSKKLFRGEPKKFENKPKQFVSYTDSMASAVNFAHGNIDNVIVEEIPINKIIAVDDMMNFSGYRTEKEWIVDSGIYE